jgi:SAM-dependent methyltransferase
MKDAYAQSELDALLETVQSRRGWDFSSMRATLAATPWNYMDEVKKLLIPTSTVLDIGTGGGERFMQLAPYFASGIGVDVDPEMVATAREKATVAPNISFQTMDYNLAGLDQHFDAIMNRHAPFNLEAIRAHLVPTGVFITQQVGEKNMQNVKEALGQPLCDPTISRNMLEATGLVVAEFREYNVEYFVHDIESLVFWLKALDMLHADIPGAAAVASADTLNRILAGNLDERGFVTNEHRYLAVVRLG